MRRPFLLLGDGPNEPTGLGRIARDLAAQLVRDFAEEIDLLHVGGPPLPRWEAWPHLPLTEFDRAQDWGASYVEAAYRDRWGEEPGILFCIWDPARLYPYLQLDLPVNRWGYLAVDGANINGNFGGPAAEVVIGFDRVLAYGRWGSQVLKPLRAPRPVPYLPHGISQLPLTEPIDSAWVRATLGANYRGQELIGCVATNQARKDLGLWAASIKTLIDRGHKVYGWLHTDTAVKAWSIPQLVQDFGLGRVVSVTTGVFTDQQLCDLYRASSVTIAPGLAEGFGYPIVESLQAGTPAVHVDHGGGRELVPQTAWRFPVKALRFDGCYALQRPVCHADDVANAIERIWRWREAVGEETVRGYCSGAVAHLAWPALWGRWASWVRKGLQDGGAV